LHHGREAHRVRGCGGAGEGGKVGHDEGDELLAAGDQVAGLRGSPGSESTYMASSIPPFSASTTVGDVRLELAAWWELTVINYKDSNQSINRSSWEGCQSSANVDVCSPGQGVELTWNSLSLLLLTCNT
jgi:hypothetical protein